MEQEGNVIIKHTSLKDIELNFLGVGNKRLNQDGEVELPLAIARQLLADSTDWVNPEELVEEVEETADGDESGEEGGEENWSEALDSMTLKEMIAFAEENDLDAAKYKAFSKSKKNMKAYLLKTLEQ